MKKKLEPFLPTVEEFQQMDGFELDDWAGKTRIVLIEREKMRDPRFHLKNGVSQVLSNKALSEAEKEKSIKILIDEYYRIMR
ncbi:hypothetical protein IIU_03845 [Bacillus cereus VD133]|uniref:Uncharacterized protein n=1 Tax=Bacillus cereus VD133 TaxID=1053233 RepID=A0A9W5PPR9_BACCE|nr:hypothetical protein [Bacillus cereus]EOO32455.1 hypothetical protein IIU_03845 [Bacillus cereus VD133]